MRLVMLDPLRAPLEVFAVIGQPPCWPVDTAAAAMAGCS